MSCGVLVVSPDAYVEAPLAVGEDAAAAVPSLGQGIAEVLRSAGHSVVESDQPRSDVSARGVIEAAWVVLAGVDLVVIVEEQAEHGYPTGPLCDRARELMVDRGPGGAIVWVPAGVPEGTAAARLLELADRTGAEGLTAGGLTAESLAVVARPLEVEPVGARADGTGERQAGLRPVGGPARLHRVRAASGREQRLAVPEGFRGGRS